MSESSGDEETWIDWFCGLNGHEVFCEVEKSYIEDSFNLYGLRNIIPNYSSCIDIILDQAEESDCEDELQQHTMDLYGLIHARYIITTRGLEAMRRKYDEKHFGTCPRMLCNNQRVVPAGSHDELQMADMRVFCPRCQDMYNVDMEGSPVDGAYFGSTFAHLFFLSYPEFKVVNTEVFVPRVFGYKIYHPSSKHRRLVHDTEGNEKGEMVEKESSQVGVAANSGQMLRSCNGNGIGKESDKLLLKDETFRGGKKRKVNG